MRLCLIIVGIMSLSALLCGCANAPGRPLPGDMPIVPSEISDFNVLYGQNCAGCHGSAGKGGAAIALADPVYLAIADNAVLRRAATNGIPGTSMPAFAQSAGGMLDRQTDRRDRERDPENAGRNQMFWAVRSRHRIPQPNLAIRRVDRKSMSSTAPLATAPAAEAGKKRARLWMDRSWLCSMIKNFERL